MLGALEALVVVPLGWGRTVPGGPLSGGRMVAGVPFGFSVLFKWSSKCSLSFAWLSNLKGEKKVSMTLT